MQIEILSLFPEMFQGPFKESIIKRAQEKEFVNINIHNLRKWAKDKHKTVDDRPFGGGTGMILKVDVLYKAISSLITSHKSLNTKIILLDAGGEKFTQKKAAEYSKLDYLLLIAGHYEGVDHRIEEHLVDDVISIGDYILTGGEIPAMVLCDAIIRLIPGVIEKPEAVKFESFSHWETGKKEVTNLLEYPQYTRPADFNGWKVPQILLSGNHKDIDKWRIEEALKKTRKKRPDLLK